MDISQFPISSAAEARASFRSSDAPADRQLSPLQDVSATGKESSSIHPVAYAQTMCQPVPVSLHSGSLHTSRPFCATTVGHDLTAHK